MQPPDDLVPLIGPFPRRGEGVFVQDVPPEERLARGVRVPADVIGVHVRDEDDVDVGRRQLELLERRRQASLLLGLPVPEPRRAHAGVDQQRPATGTEDVAGDRQAPELAREEIRVLTAGTLPVVVGGAGVELRERAGAADRVDEGLELEAADYHRTRGGAGSPCPSCHEITGLRSTPMPSISASITSPGFR